MSIAFMLKSARRVEFDQFCQFQAYSRARAHTLIVMGILRRKKRPSGQYSAASVARKAALVKSRSRKTVITVSDRSKYDCTTCPYPRYKDGSVIFCDVCIRKILDEQKEKKERKEQPNE